MINDRSNLLCVLHKWATRQDENFITDAFAHLMRSLCQRSPTAGDRILSCLTGGSCAFSQSELASVEIQTQIRYPCGIPDVTIRGSGNLSLVEAKVEEDVDIDQLQSYREYLNRQSAGGVYANASLVLITRYPVNEEIARQIEPLNVIQHRWCQVSQWLEDMLRQRLLNDPVSEFLTSQFVDFLKHRNIAMKQIRSEIILGLESLRSLQAMLGEASSNCQLSSVKSSFSFDYIGYNVSSNRYWIGVQFDRPQFIEFYTNEMCVSESQWKAKDVGGILDDHLSKRGAVRWVKRLDLREQFLELPQDQQLKRLELFLRECVQTAESIREDQP